MRHVCIVSNDRSGAAVLGRHLAPTFAAQVIGLNELADAIPGPHTLINTNLNDATVAENLRRWLRQRPEDGAALFAVNRGSRVQTAQAYSIGATDVVFRPIEPVLLISKLIGNAPSTTSRPSEVLPVYGNGIVAGISALEHVFASATSDSRINQPVLKNAGESLVRHIEQCGFGDWVLAVRAHHSRTYQHCLLVSGAAAAFANQLGFNNADRCRVAIAGLLHDIGKARLPLTILDKPARLDEEEKAIMRQHVTIGHKVLQSADGLHPEMLDMVLHHHEFLDGSGYPHGLQGSELSDLTRVVTITDIFAALIEYRAYCPSMSGQEAYQVLLDMGTKLDQDLVRAFQPLSRVQY